MTLRSTLFSFWRLRADAHAVRRGRVGQRVARRVVYRLALHAAGWLTRQLRMAK